jgi:hypothetical protein
MPAGRAVQNLRQYFHPTSLDGSCENEPVIGNVLTNPESICIEPSGEVDICWHLAIGNAKEMPLNRIADLPYGEILKMAHGIDERISIENLVFGTSVLYTVVEKFMT